jgi:hypothetical protein
MGKYGGHMGISLELNFRTYGKIWQTYEKIWRTYGKKRRTYLWPRTYGNFTLIELWKNNGGHMGTPPFFECAWHDYDQQPGTIESASSQIIKRNGFIWIQQDKARKSGKIISSTFKSIPPTSVEAERAFSILKLYHFCVNISLKHYISLVSQ